MKKVPSLFIFLFLLSFAYAQRYPSSYTDGKYVTVNGAAGGYIIGKKMDKKDNKFLIN